MAAVGRGDGLAFVGWTGLLLILATIAGVIAGTGRHAPASIFFLAAAVSIEIAALGLIAGFTDVSSAAELAAIAAAWMLLWSTVAWALCRLGTGLACALPLLAALLFLAAPVIAMPLVRAAGTGTSSQQFLVQTIAHACPVFACVDAVKPQIRIDWPELPGMYAHSGLGQEVPMELPNGWTCAALYTAAALLAGTGAWLKNRPRK